jgi:5-formyltetrahydrofolate cyclo-ligase
VQTKVELRAAAVSRRAALTDAQRRAAGEALAEALHGVLAGAGRVAAYAAIGTEPPTGALLRHCREVLLPVLRDDGDLDWALAPDGTDLIPAARGLLEPTGRRWGVDAVADCDVVLVPALAVDRAGNRLGRGGGSYDRALRRARGLTIALLYDGELAAALPVEPHDVPVAAAVLPAEGLVRLPA